MGHEIKISNKFVLCVVSFENVRKLKNCGQQQQQQEQEQEQEQEHEFLYEIRRRMDFRCLV
jgi:large-conductance mechanosensitive channel